MDNFDLRKYLVENKVTTNSRMLNEADDVVIPAIKETAALLKQEGIPFKMVSFQDMEADLQHGMDVEGDTSKGVIKLGSKKGTIYIAEYGYNSISISGKNVEDEDDYVTNSPEEMVQVLKQDFLNESFEMMKENKKKPEKVSKVEFANGKTFEEGGKDEEGNIIISIYKYGKGYGVDGQEYDWDDDEYGDEAYTYWYDLKGNESSENDIVTTDYAY